MSAYGGHGGQPALLIPFFSRSESPGKAGILVQPAQAGFIRGPRIRHAAPMTAPRSPARSGQAGRMCDVRLKTTGRIYDAILCRLGREPRLDRKGTRLTSRHAVN